MASREISYKGVKYDVSYEIIGSGKEILFLHGWGAKKEIMKKAFAAYLGDFKQIYVDLAGFGASSIKHPLNTKNYAGIMREFLASIGANPPCVVGHSFGGKVATLLEPKILVLLSTAGILNKKSFSVRAKIMIFKFFKMLGFGHLYRLFATKDVAGMSATMYETLKNVVNEDFKNIFRRCKSRTLIFWGEDDKATPVNNGKIISEIMPDCVDFDPLSGDHFFFLTHGELIANKMKALILECESQNKDTQSSSESSSSDLENSNNNIENSKE